MLQVSKFWLPPLVVAVAVLRSVPVEAATPVKRPADPPPKIEITDEARQAAQSSNAFAFDLYAQLRRQDGNLFYSPASISTALAMTYAGAAGGTGRQMAEVLHFDQADEPLHSGFGTLGRLLNAQNRGVRLQMANRIWGAKGYPFSPDFLAATREHYGADLLQLNFAQPEPSRQTINRWVEQQTAGKIQNLVPPGAVGPDTRLVLTNAIYFHGAWQDEFWKNATRPAPFRRTETEQRRIPLMHRSGHFGYSETKDVQVLTLPYVGGELSMVIMLPKEIAGLEKLESQLTAKNLDAWISSQDSKLVQVFLPKFKVTSQFSLAQTLRSMGMELAFSGEADFSRMSSAEDLMLSEVIHKAFVDVNEEGTEAAAATAVIAPKAAAVREPEKPVEFRADHPFVFLIRDNRTQAVLFLGRLLDPPAN
ncbi:MAG TPA: serpin family protein [Pirellulales bacterium]|nr:serpin family protein [Pirellulales bacterium]